MSLTISTEIKKLDGDDNEEEDPEEHNHHHDNEANTSALGKSEDGTVTGLDASAINENNSQMEGITKRSDIIGEDENCHDDF